MKEKLKIVTAFLCGAVFFSGVSYAATGDIIAKPANFKVVVDGQEKKFKNKIVTIEGTTYLSIRDTAKAVDKEVDFKNGVINLNSGTSSANNSTTTINTNNSEVSSIDNFKKLPLTLVKGNYSVTVSSVSLTDISTDISVVVKNNSNEKTTIEYGTATGANKNVSGKEYKILGVVRTGEDFPNEIDANTSLEGVIRKEKVDSGTENLLFHMKIGRETFSFYIDTKGDL